VVVFKGHSLDGSSIVSLYLSKNSTVEFVHAGWATRWALPRFLVEIKFCMTVVYRGIFLSFKFHQNQLSCFGDVRRLSTLVIDVLVQAAIIIVIIISFCTFLFCDKYL